MFFFFFKQKTAYEMRISDWSSDVCSSDLVEHRHHLAVDVLDTVAAVDQHQRALEHRPPAQIVVDQEAPFFDDIPGRLGKAVSGHVDEPEHQRRADVEIRSEEHTSELQSLMRISYAVFCLKKKQTINK